MVVVVVVVKSDILINSALNALCLFCTVAILTLPEHNMLMQFHFGIYLFSEIVNIAWHKIQRAKFLLNLH